MEAYNSTETKNENPALGKLQDVCHIRFSVGYFVPFIVIIVPLLGFFMFWNAPTIFQKIASLIFTVIFALPIIFVLWKLLPKVRDELRIYENGFTYKSPKGLQLCLWNEIKDGSFSDEFDGRILMTSTVKKNGEEIIFAYKMQGLDKVNRGYDEQIYREIKEEEDKQDFDAPESLASPGTDRSLGELENTYRVKYGLWTLFLYSFICLPWASLTIGMFATKEFILLIFVIPLSAVLYILLQNSWRVRHDALSIYQNGFIYKSRKGLQTCLWKEILFCGYSKGNISLIRIKKKNDESIDFATEIQGLRELQTKIVDSE